MTWLTWSRRCSSSRIPAKKVGRAWRVNLDDFEKFMRPDNVKRASGKTGSTIGRRSA